MNKTKFLIISSSFIVIAGLAGYFGLIFGVPAVVNSQKFTPHLENFIRKKTGFHTKFNGLKISISPLFIATVNCKNFMLTDGKKTAVKVAEIQTGLDLKTLSFRNIKSNTVYADTETLQKVLAKRPKQASQNIDILKIPDINIDKIDIIINSRTGQRLELKNVKALNAPAQKIKTVSFLTFYEIPKIHKQVAIGQRGFLYIKNNEIFADKFQMNYENSLITIDGKLYGKKASRDITLKAHNIPVDKTMDTLLYFQKLNDKNKKFIENFKDFSGSIDINLLVKDNAINGKITAKNLRAKSVLFNVPVNFKTAEFILKNNEITSTAHGFLGGEPVLHKLLVENITSPKRAVTGEVQSTLTAKQIKTYLPETYKLKDSADAKVIYKIQNKTPVVEYFFNLKEGADLIYKDAYLGLRNKNRLLYAKTIKAKDGLKLDRYEYSMNTGSGKEWIISGDGFFRKRNGKLTPEFVTCQTNGYAPAYVTGSFGKYVEGGKFKGKLKYDFINDKITGNFELVKTLFNDFFVRKANVSATLDGIDITAEGHYKYSNFNCVMRAANRLDGNFIVHKMELFLEQFIIEGKKSEASATHKHPHPVDFDKQIENVSSKIRNIDMTIESWNILAGEIYIDDILVQNLALFGSLKNSVFDFTIPKVRFAQGLLEATGKYNFNDNSSDIKFSAKDVNSNEAAILLFDLPDQISGLAQATLHVQTFNKFQDLYAKGNFKVDDGFLPSLGDTEFMLGRKGKKHKLRVSNLTNIDFSHKDTLSSDLKGSFELYNYDLKNINITSQQSFMSLFISGDYNILTSDAVINIYGKYNMDAPKGIKILFVPLNWILKLVLRPEDSREIYKTSLEKIPSVSGKPERWQYFRVNANGNLKTNDVNVVLKRIK